MERIMRKLGRTTLAVLLCVGAFLLLRYTGPVGDRVRSGIDVCLRVMIPSLFCFLILSEFARQTGVLTPLLRPLDRILHRVLKLPEGSTTLFFFALIGGYPAGSRLLSDTVRENGLSAEDADRLLPFFVFAGPSYLLGGVGIPLFHQSGFGVILILSQLLATLVMAFLFLRLGPPIPEIKAPPKRESVSAALTLSVAKAARTMASICGFILLFHAVLTFLPTGWRCEAPALYTALCGFLEVTEGVSACSLLPPHTALIAACGITAWGGCCIWLQIAAVLQGSGISLRRTLLLRLPYVLLSTAFCILLSRLPVFRLSEATSLQSNIPLQQSAPSRLADLSLVLLCFLLIYLIEKKKERQT